MSQLSSPLVLILIVAAAISAATGESTEAIIIIGIVVANTAIGTYQELKAEHAIEELERMAAPRARVLRDGRIKEIPAREIVPGDVILLSAGDVVPADAILIEANGLEVDESILTGESYPVEKRPWTGRRAPDNSEQVFAGTSVIRGGGKAVVVATGRKTRMGKIGKLLEAEYGESSAQREMRRLGVQISRIVLAIAVIVFLALYARGTGLETAAMVAIALAVAAVPEGLPAVVTITMALGARAMSKDGVIVRRLSAIQDLGSLDVICTDKTGTITENRLRVVEFWGDQQIRNLAGACTDGSAKDPVDLAIREWSTGKKTYVRIVRPFSEEWRYMEVVARDGNQEWHGVKGAPETILSIIPRAKHGRKIIEISENFARRGLKPLAIAAWSGDAVLLGVVGLQDPVRAGVRDAIERAKRAGIRTVMITGDHPETARSIAEEVGIPAKRVLTGEEIGGMDDAELQGVVETVSVFARIPPEQKLRIVEALRRNGHRVAMTGDGVNDAPALKAADVGIAMGNGSDVAKSAADVVLSNNGYEHIVKAIMWGRRVINNIKSSVTYLLSANTAEVVAVFTGSIFEWVIMRPVQILWLNLVSDGPPALILTTDPAPRNVERMKPAEFAQILSKGDLWKRVILFGTILGIGLVLIYALNAQNIAVAQTAVLTGFVIMEAMRMQTVRGSPIWTNKLLAVTVGAIIALQLVLVYTPAGTVLGLVPLGAGDLAEIIAVVLAMLGMSRFFSI